MIAVGAALDQARGVYGINQHYTYARDGLITKLSTKNVLAYTPGKSTSFTEAQALSGIQDGSTTSGLRAESAGATCGITLTFSAPVFLNEMVLYITQFNGNYNGFSGFEIWDSTMTTKHYDTTSLGYGTHTLDLAETCENAASVFIAICKNPFTYGKFSLAELVARGYET